MATKLTKVKEMIQTNDLSASSISRTRATTTDIPGSVELVVGSQPALTSVIPFNDKNDFNLQSEVKIPKVSYTFTYKCGHLLPIALVLLAIAIMGLTDHTSTFQRWLSFGCNLLVPLFLITPNGKNWFIFLFEGIYTGANFKFPRLYPYCAALCLVVFCGMSAYYTDVGFKFVTQSVYFYFLSLLLSLTMFLVANETDQLAHIRDAAWLVMQQNNINIHYCGKLPVTEVYANLLKPRHRALASCKERTFFCAIILIGMGTVLGLVVIWKRLEESFPTSFQPAQFNSFSSGRIEEKVCILIFYSLASCLFGHFADGVLCITICFARLFVFPVEKANLLCDMIQADLTVTDLSSGKVATGSISGVCSSDIMSWFSLRRYNEMEKILQSKRTEWALGGTLIPLAFLLAYLIIQNFVFKVPFDVRSVLWVYYVLRPTNGIGCLLLVLYFEGIEV